MSQVYQTALNYFETAYSSEGFDAQRRFPNEEFCRFMGRNYFALPREKRANVSILETGCGSGANLWMVAKEGFDAHGIDLSPSALELCHEMLKSYGCSARVKPGSMTDLDYADNSMDAIVDIFSSHCLTQEQGAQYLSETHRVLKSGGKFFSYFPSTRSDTWTDVNNTSPQFQNRIDDDTLNGLHRETGPYFGNNHPFRFLHPRRYASLLEENGLLVTYCETLTRTYRQQSEVFEFVVIEGTKP